MVSHNAMLVNPKRQRQSQTKTNVCKLLEKQPHISSTENLITLHIAASKQQQTNLRSAVSRCYCSSCPGTESSTGPF